MAVANVWDKHRLKIDEPSWLPIGTTWLRGRAYLLVGCAGCQVEVITQALQKARVEDYDISVEARFETEELGPELEEYPDHLSWRYTTIALDIDLATSEENEAKVERLLDLVEDAYIVSRSVERSGGFEISKVLSTIRLFSESDDGTNYLSSWRTARSPFAPRPPVVFGFGSINPQIGADRIFREERSHGGKRVLRLDYPDLARNAPPLLYGEEGDYPTGDSLSPSPVKQKARKGGGRRRNCDVAATAFRFDRQLTDRLTRTLSGGAIPLPIRNGTRPLVGLHRSIASNGSDDDLKLRPDWSLESVPPAPPCVWTELGFEVSLVPRLAVIDTDLGDSDLRDTAFATSESNATDLDVATGSLNASHVRHGVDDCPLVPPACFPVGFLFLVGDFDPS